MPEDLDARAAGARRLKGKVCVVTGAGQGIGRATAKRLGQEGRNDCGRRSRSTPAPLKP